MRFLLVSVLFSLLLTNCPTENSQLVEMTASVSPEDAGEVNPPEGTYLPGKEITIETNAFDDQWEFTGWTGDTTASDDSLTFVITRDMNLVANYEIPSDAQPVLSTTVAPQNSGTVDPQGGTYEFGDSVDVEATPAAGFQFVEWSGDTSSTDNPLTLAMNKNYEITANFVDKPKLTATPDPTEGGTVDPAEGTFDFGTVVDVEATPAEGWRFVEWSGDTSSTANPLSLTMDKSYNITAQFEEDPTLSVSVDPTEGGNVDPAEGSFDFGTSVDVEATAAEGWEFVEWSGDTSSTSNPLALTMEKSYNLTANFKRSSTEFTNQITVTDGPNSMDLTFGMDTEATAGFDDGLDRDLPPPPPAGSFYAQFNIPDYALAEDYRPVSDEATWTLEFEPESDPEEERTITINWDFSDTNHVGDLTLTAPNNSSFEDIDMKSNTSVEVPNDINKLQIISSN